MHGWPKTIGGQVWLHTLRTYVNLVKTGWDNLVIMLKMINGTSMEYVVYAWWLSWLITTQALNKKIKKNICKFRVINITKR